MNTTQRNKVIAMIPACARQASPSRAMATIDHVDLVSLCVRPDALVLMPARANTLLPRQHTQVEHNSLGSTITPIHKPISGYDHE
jgi:hypothetical protein